VDGQPDIFNTNARYFDEPEELLLKDLEEAVGGAAICVRGVGRWADRER